MVVSLVIFFNPRKCDPRKKTDLISITVDRCSGAPHQARSTCHTAEPSVTESITRCCVGRFCVESTVIVQARVTPDQSQPFCSLEKVCRLTSATVKNFNKILPPQKGRTNPRVSKPEETSQSKCTCQALAPKNGPLARKKATLRAHVLNGNKNGASRKGTRCPPFQQERNGYGSKLNHQGTAGFSPWFYLPGFRFWGYPIFDPQPNGTLEAVVDHALKTRNVELVSFTSAVSAGPRGRAWLLLGNIFCGLVGKSDLTAKFYFCSPSNDSNQRSPQLNQGATKGS